MVTGLVPERWFFRRAHTTFYHAGMLGPWVYPVCLDS
jgi:hypothetical protein